MTSGEKYIKQNYIKEVTYYQAIEECKNDLKMLGITDRTQVYDNDMIFDNPIYPQNAELFDEFCEQGEEYPNQTELCLYLARLIGSDLTK